MKNKNKTMKIKVFISIIALSTIFSCKQKSEVEEKATQDSTTENVAPAAVTSIQLANYSDDNWKNGVGFTYNMLLVDFSDSRLELISKGTELHLPSGEVLPYIGYEKQDNYIQIMLGDKKPTDYQSSIEYPNDITIK